jgi:hypothetical protein
MTKDPSAQQSTVVASYWTRRDAEMARDYLDDAGLSAFVRADDAGGLHPELQRSNGVHLIVLGDVARQAHEILKEAGMLPGSKEEAGSKENDPLEGVTPWGGVRALLVVFAVIATIMMLGIWWQFG